MSPKYCHHKASGQAFVRLNGHYTYLGPYGSPESKLAYKRAIDEWRAAGCVVPNKRATVSEVVKAFLLHAKSERYRRADGTPGYEYGNVYRALTFVSRLYGDMPASEFDSFKLEAVRRSWLDAGRVRKSINRDVNRIKLCFRWALARRLVPAEIVATLSAVESLRGSSKPVPPAPEKDVEAVLPLLTSPVRAMVKLQVLTGARPGEISTMRPCDIDQTVQPWRYRPGRHKTEHLGHERIILLGPKAQEILKPFLARDPDAWCFSPEESAIEHYARRRTSGKRKTPYQRRDNGKRRPGSKYTRDAYLHAIVRACDRAGVPRFSPHQLRHLAATKIQRQFGWEVARAILGHRSLPVTQLYVANDIENAADAVRDAG